MIAQIIVDVVHSKLSHPFSYIIPKELNIQIGSWVKVPLGARTVDGIVVDILNNEQVDIAPEKLRPIIKLNTEYTVVLEPLILLAKTMADNVHCPLSETLRLMLPAGMRTNRVKMKTELTACLLPDVNIDNAIKELSRSKKRVFLIQLLSDFKPHSITELGQYIKNPKESLQYLHSHGFINLYKKEVFRSPNNTVIKPTQPPVLTKSQKESLDIMFPSLIKGEGSFLLNGVTGSGKTEVYLNMVEKMVELGKSTIILVPEIALTPQMVRWFYSRFNDSIAVLHSRLTEGQRFDEWRRIRFGNATIVVGARSAIFAPVSNLGLIVIDEEHEQTYISDKHPRYDAREIAKLRCHNEHATLLLSSATPSILSFAKAKRGDYTLIEMNTRVHQRPLPTVHIVDMRKELKNGNRSLFSLLLLQKMQECFNKKEQVMLFINRRGFHTFVNCRSCGYVVKCKHCDVSLTMHMENDNTKDMRCHLCGLHNPIPTVCPECNSSYIRYFGSGTQRVQAELLKHFPEIKVVRMDIDTTRERESHAKLLDQFGSGEAQVLLGTQMITKGLDFPNVTLVGVIAADMSLNLPDYRAPERTFQLITQVSGRAGRSTKQGEVVLQTYKPDHPCIQAAATQNYRAFFEMEFARRRTGLYPPFTTLARLLVEGETENEVKNCTDNLHSQLINKLTPHPELKKLILFMRVDEAPVKKIRDKFRYHVLLKIFERPQTQDILQLLSELASSDSENVQIYLEVNPVTMM